MHHFQTVGLLLFHHELVWRSGCHMHGIWVLYAVKLPFLFGIGVGELGFSCSQSRQITAVHFHWCAGRLSVVVLCGMNAADPYNVCGALSLIFTGVADFLLCFTEGADCRGFACWRPCKMVLLFACSTGFATSWALVWLVECVVWWAIWALVSADVLFSFVWFSHAVFPCYHMWYKAFNLMFPSCIGILWISIVWLVLRFLLQSPLWTSYLAGCASFLKTAIDRFTCFTQCALIFVMAMLSMSSSVRPASLTNLRKSFPSQRSVSLSFCILSLTAIESVSRLVWSYHSSNVSRYFEGTSLRLHGFPAVARAASVISAITWCNLLLFESPSPL